MECFLLPCLLLPPPTPQIPVINLITMVPNSSFLHSAWGPGLLQPALTPVWSQASPTGCPQPLVVLSRASQLGPTHAHRCLYPCQSFRSLTLILNLLGEYQLISCTCLNIKGFSILQLLLQKVLTPSYQQLRVNLREGRLYRRCLEEGKQQRHRPQAISFRDRCQMEDSIRLFKFLKTYGWCFVLPSLF